jgi:phosphate transport system permease protein
MAKSVEPIASKIQSARLDTVFKIVAWGSTTVLVGTFAWLMISLVSTGWERISIPFFTQLPENFGRSGGIASVLVSTGLILGICLCLALPLGVLTATWLSEISPKQRPLRILITRSLDLLAAVPSIVFGLFGMIFFCQTLNMGFSILSGGLTLALMILPIVVTTVYAALQTVPGHLRSGGVALGLSQTTTLWRLLLPAAAPGIVVGSVLGIARAIAETAALIFTSGYVTRMPESIYDSGRTLSVHIYDLAINVSGGESSAAATALVLMFALFLINVTAAMVTRFFHRRSAIV